MPDRSTPRTYIPFMDVMRVAAIIGVIVIHAMAPAYTAADKTWPTLLLRSLLTPAVPLFVMMSGVLNLPAAAHRRGAAAFLRSRVVRLLPAAIAWTLVYTLWVKPVLWHDPLTAPGAVRDLLLSSSAPHLYFLWIVLGLSLLTPVIAPFVQRSATHAYAVGIVATAWTPVTYMAERALHYAGSELTLLPKSVLTIFIPYVGFYVLGYALMSAPPSRRLASAMLAAIVPLGVLAAWAVEHSLGAGPVLDFAIKPSYYSPLTAVTATCMFGGLAGLALGWRVGQRGQRVLRILANASFGVYLVHMIPVTELRRLIPALGAESLGACLALAALVTVLCFPVVALGQRIPGLRRLL